MDIPVDVRCLNIAETLICSPRHVSAFEDPLPSSPSPSDQCGGCIELACLT